MAKRKRRSFSSEYKAEVVKLIEDGGKSLGQVARDLDLTETAVRRWVAQSETDAGRGEGKLLSTDEREELTRLRRENRQLRMEREVLKNPPPAVPAPVVGETRVQLHSPVCPRAEAVSFLVALTPLKNMAQGQLRICVW